MAARLVSNRASRSLHVPLLVAMAKFTRRLPTNALCGAATYSGYNPLPNSERYFPPDSKITSLSKPVSSLRKCQDMSTP